MALLLDKPFIRGISELPNASRLAAVIVHFAGLPDEKLKKHSLDYIILLCPFEPHYLLTNFKYWLKKTVCERSLQLKSNDPLLANWNCADGLNISPFTRHELFVKVPV